MPVLEKLPGNQHGIFRSQMLKHTCIYSVSFSDTGSNSEDWDWSLKIAV